jgi:hypothetical protein
MKGPYSRASPSSSRLLFRSRLTRLEVPARDDGRGWDARKQANLAARRATSLGQRERAPVHPSPRCLHCILFPVGVAAAPIGLRTRSRRLRPRVSAPSQVEVAAGLGKGWHAADCCACMSVWRRARAVSRRARVQCWTRRSVTRPAACRREPRWNPGIGAAVWGPSGNARTTAYVAGQPGATTGARGGQEGGQPLGWPGSCLADRRQIV